MVEIARFKISWALKANGPAKKVPKYWAHYTSAYPPGEKIGPREKIAGGKAESSFSVNAYDSFVSDQLQQLF